MAKTSGSPPDKAVTSGETESIYKDALVATVSQASGSMEFDEDIVLVDRFLSGDVMGFERLYRKYYERVYAITRGVLGACEEIEDVVQEIFTLVFRNLKRFDRRSRFSTWLFRVAVNRSIQQTRGAKWRRRPMPLSEAVEVPAEQQFDAGADPKIAEALSCLKPADRALLVLFYWEEQSLQEIAETLGCGVNAAKTRLFRARERFKQFYEEGAE